MRARQRLLLMFTPLVLILVASLAAANGANDVAKGIATLAGSGTARYRTALLWGAVTTFLGAAVSGVFAGRMLQLFTKGIVTVAPTATFTLAVAVAAIAWVAFATRLRMPVSTTHALIGALVGAGVAVSSAAVAWGALLPKLAVPLLASIGVAHLLSMFVGVVAPAPSGECVCVQMRALDTGRGLALPQLAVSTGTVAECRVHGRTAVRFTTDALHWLSSGMVGFARGLNDTPKIVAVAGIVLGTTVSLNVVVWTVALAMLVGGVVAGLRVATVLGEGIVHMQPREGLQANLATALLVAAGAHLGLPMSTTHVSTGAIAGIAGRDGGRLNLATLRHVALAWAVTPFVAGLLAWTSYRLFAMAGTFHIAL